jgi:hypothetical protein
MHEPLMIASKHLTVLCVSKRCLPSLLIDEVDIITSELVLRCFVVYLDTGGGGGDHGDLRGDNSLIPVHQEERCLPCGLTCRCLVVS